MRKILYVFLALGVLLLGACGTDSAKEELEKNDDNKAEAKIDTKEDDADEVDADDSGESDDVWTYYDDATWTGELNGLQLEIQKVVVTDKAPTLEDEDANASAVGVKFKIENTTTDRIFTTYPDQATLVTSTGEQIESPDMWVSDHIGGEIHEGVIKEGNIIWYLERGHAEEIEWIKLDWNAQDEDYFETFDDSLEKEFSVKLELK